MENPDILVICSNIAVALCLETKFVCCLFLIMMLQKASLGPDGSTPLLDTPRPHTEGALFMVYRQPIALDRFTIHDVRPPDNSGLHCILLYFSFSFRCHL